MMLVLLVITALLVCLGASATGEGRQRRRWALVGAAATTAAMIWLGMASAPNQTDGPYDRLRVTLEAMELRLDEGAVYRVGGDPDRDDIVIAPRAGVRIGRGALPPGVLDMRVQGGTVELRLGEQADSLSRGIVRLRSRGAPDRWLGAAPSTATQACVSQCGSPAATLAELEGGRAYFADTAPVRGGGVDDAPPALVFTNSDGMAFVAGGQPEDVEILRPNDAEIQIDILEADRGRPPAGDIAGQPGRLTLRRTFFARVRDGRLVLTPQTPQSASIDHAGDADRSVLRIAPEAEIAREGTDERVVGFSLLGQSFAHDLAGVVIDPARQSDGASLVYHQNGSSQTFRQTTRIGAGRVAAVTVQPLDFEAGVYAFAAPLTTLSLVIFALATWRIRLVDPVAGVAFAATEFLLTMRLLVAIEGAFVDAAAKAQTSVADALIAIPLGLLVVLAVHPRGRRQGVAMIALAAAAVSAWWIARVSDLATAGIVWVGALVAIGVLVLLVRDRLVGRQASGEGVDDANAIDPGRLPEPSLPAWMAPWAYYDRLTQDRPLIVLAVMVVLILGLRGVFALLGWREGLFVGGERIALSLIFVPLTLLAFAPLMANAWRGWTVEAAPEDGLAGRIRQVFRIAFPAIALNAALILGVFLASGIARDNGFAIYALPAILASVIVGQHARRTGRQRLLDGAIALAAGLAIIVCADLSMSHDWGLWPLAVVVTGIGALLLGLRPQALWLAPAAAAAAMLLVVNLPMDLAPTPDISTDLESAIALEDNDLRLLAALNPQRLSDVGTRSAEGLEDTLIHLRSYGDTLLGRGYFNLPDPTVLRAYHLTDNAAAVHLVSPFGRLGAAAFLSVTAALAFSACWAATRPRESSPSIWMGALSALTLSSISIYIVLANLLAAPFTGRNVYFLAPWSMADLVEGLMLISMVLLMLCRAEEAGDV